ncbi:MAG: DUF1028 domain-containing protein [bacterium]|nr:MAG: DUF1028 domain-containing protein [bacterium]
MSDAASGPVSPIGRPVHTYSIVARDSVNGDLGVAVQSHWFSVGPIVPWARAGVGAVATQSLVLVSYGPRGLDLMEEGCTAGESLDRLVSEDRHAAVRQVAMIDAAGNVAAHTGDSCISYASHHIGSGYSVQANMMLTEDVVGAMSSAYEASKGDLAERMLAALRAAEEAGGDIRGRQSAAIMIVRGVSTGEPWSDVIMELRVEDHPEPVQELERLVTLNRAYTYENKGDEAMAEGDLTGALEAYGMAARLAPENIELRFWQGVSLLNTGHEADAMKLFEFIFKADPNWKELLMRLPASGLVRVPPEELERLFSGH